MIPKIIHYCWFGGNPKPKLAKKCIKSWEKYCPDYQIIEWNESNFDISSAPLYVRQAYEARKWAFVTDYVRLKVVYENGGIYLDTDVEIIKPIDDLLKYEAYFGLELGEYINTGLGFGSIKQNVLLYNIMQDYKDLSFKRKDNKYDMLPCPIRNSHVFKEYGFNLDGTTQVINNIAVFSSEYFCPRKWDDKKIKLTDKTYSIHHFTASWQTKGDIIKEKQKMQSIVKREKRLLSTKLIIKKLIGTSLYNKLRDITHKIKCPK